MIWAGPIFVQALASKARAGPGRPCEDHEARVKKAIKVINCLKKLPEAALAADKISVVSAEKTSVVSRAKTSVAAENRHQTSQSH